ncbi:MAG: PspA/IM30 family protein [Prochloraceae cyanobacterium]
MSLLKRVWRVIQVNVNSLINESEDPEKVLEEAIMDMQDKLVQMRQAVAGAIATQKRLERQMTQNELKAQEWYRRAQLALDKGNEELAREALQRKQPYQQYVRTLQVQIEQQNNIIIRLKQDLRSLETKISQAKAKKDIYIARARSAIASQKIQELTGKVSTSGYSNAFERMEAKVIELEARSEAIANLETDELEQQFAALEDGNNVNAELAKMKAKRLNSRNRRT